MRGQLHKENVYGKRHAPNQGEGYHRRTKITELKNNKHIPEEYFISSYNQRLSLLRGLMDSDGTISPEDLSLFKVSDNVDDAYTFLRERIEKYYINVPSRKK